jgi:lipase chaperone LimK
MLHGRLEFFSRNVHKLTKHMTTLVDQHKGESYDYVYGQKCDYIHQLSKMDAQVLNEMLCICCSKISHTAGVEAGMKFSERVKDIAAQEPFADLQDRLVALSEITERLALERKSIMCDRAESQVLEKLAEVQSRVINPTKALLRDRDSGIRALVKVTLLSKTHFL